MANAGAAGRRRDTTPWYVIVWHWADFFFPFIIMEVGYLIPAMWYRFPNYDNLPLADQVNLNRGLLAQLALALLWLIGDFIVISNRDTLTGRLQINALISSIFALIMLGCTVWMYRGEELGWWLVVPTMAAVVDSLLTTFLAINNADQKNPTDIHRG
ncbi:hypothetical protein H7X87_04195 [Acetobacteraceae bacterium]|nr:hypothetical protein [Candidatus Parcubacteria bacterium]